MKKIAVAAMAVTLICSGCTSLPDNRVNSYEPSNENPLQHIRETDMLHGIAYSYPAYFTATTGEGEAAQNTTILKSGYSILNDAAGDTTVFPFEIAITYSSSTKPIAIADILAPMVPGWKEQYEAYQAHKPYSDMRIMTVAGKTAYRFTAGAEGMNIAHIVIPKNDKEYVNIRILYIGDTLSQSIQPKPITESDQLKIVDDVLASFSFIKE